MKYLQHYRKAIQGAVGAGVLALAAALFIGSPGHITDSEWYTIIAALVGGAGFPVIGKANAPKPAKNEKGAADVVTILVIVLLVLLILFLLGVLR